MVVSRMHEVGAALDAETLEHPEHALVSDLIPAALGAAGAACLGLLFSQSPVIEATLALAASTT